VDFEAAYVRISALLRAGKSPVEPSAVYAVMIPFSRVPTSEDLGHADICDSQVVQNETTVQRVERIAIGDDLKTVEG
jgi:hypothetical protein